MLNLRFCVDRVQSGEVRPLSWQRPRESYSKERLQARIRLIDRVLDYLRDGFGQPRSRNRPRRLQDRNDSSKNRRCLLEVTTQRSQGRFPRIQTRFNAASTEAGRAISTMMLSSSNSLLLACSSWREKQMNTTEKPFGFRGSRAWASESQMRVLYTLLV